MSVPQGFLPGGGHTVEMYGAARKKRSTERPLPGRSRKMVCGENLTETAGFAEEELFGYLQRMVKDLPENYHVVFSVDENLFPEGQNDGYRVQMEETGGRITGNNERSLLLAVYDYLHFIGCRFRLRSMRLYPALEGRSFGRLMKNRHLFIIAVYVSRERILLRIS